MKQLLLFILYALLIFEQTQIGQDIDGEAFNDFSDESVSLSLDGSIVVIGALGNDGNIDKSGHVRIYDLSTVLSTESFK